METKSEKKHPGGRPHKYKPEYCQMLIDHMAKGYSFESFAGVIGVATSTIELWANGSKKKSPIAEFSGAKQRAFAKSRMFWEKLALDNMVTFEKEKFNSTVWIFTMKNRFGWRDKIENTGHVQVSPYIIERRNGDQVELGMTQTEDKEDV